MTCHDWDIQRKSHRDVRNIRYTGDRTAIPGRLVGAGLAGSLHPGGCNVTLGDGSVRFIAETTDLSVLRAICTMSQGEVTEMP